MVNEKRYENGLRLVVKQMQGLMSVTMGILVGTGGSSETDAEDGISHFIEHMQFKGTHKRNAFELSDAFDRLGAQVNAYTGKEHTCYYAKSTTEHTAACFELLSDLFLHATYPEEEIEREKGVICEEISMNEDLPEDLCLDLLANAYFGKENYGRNILGPAENVKGFTLDDVARYKRARYCPENIVVSFAGAIDFATAQALVESYFGDLEKGAFEKRTPNLFFAKGRTFKKKKIEQAHIALAFPSISRADKRTDVFKAINSVVGGSMSSRLFQEVREKQGLAYSVYSYLSLYPECGVQGIYAGVNPSKQGQAYESVRKVLKDVKANGITKDEFLRSREQMKASLFFGNENTNSQMLLYGVRMLTHNDLFDFERKLAEINAMTHEQAQAAVSECFDEENMAIAVVGNEKPSFLN